MKTKKSIEERQGYEDDDNSNARMEDDHDKDELPLAKEPILQAGLRPYGQT
ncbi:MAG: hypothetical protein ACJAWL_003545 [Motiliproteus sp.]|jgi:hypothetical protein